jgi:hypothetical protein
MRLFLVDVVSITKANCAQPMNYYASLTLVLVGLKVALVVLLMGPWLWGKLTRSRFSVARRYQQHQVRRQISVIEDKMAGRRRASIARAIQQSLPALETDVLKVDWLKVFKASFMLLFVAYPGAYYIITTIVTQWLVLCTATQR